jgi:pilus assembly protein CpaB
MKIFRNRYFLICISIICAAALCFGIAPKINKASNSQTQIIRVIKRIPEGTAITKEMVQTVSVGGYNLPTGILKDTQSVIGKYTTAVLDPGDYILDSKVSDKSQSPYLSGLDGKKEAISISIKTFSAGLSGKLQSGDIVSLIVSNYGTEKQTLAPAELRYVKLLAATNAQGKDTDQVEKEDKDESTDKNNNIPATLTLLVNSEQAQKLVDYETNGSLYATLVYRGTEDEAKAFLNQQDSYFNNQTAASGSQQGTGETGGAVLNGR